MARALFLRRSSDSTDLDPDLPAVLIAEPGGERRAFGFLAGRWVPFELAEDGTITWSLDGPGAPSGGHLFLGGDDGGGCVGMIAVGGGEPRPLLGSPIPPTAYATEITVARQPAGTDPGSLPAEAWKPAAGLKLGYELEPGTGFPREITELDGQDVSESVSLTTTPADDLQLGLALEPDIACEADPNLLCALSVDFSTFGATFTGTVSVTCADRSGPGAYLFRGDASNPLLAELEAAALELSTATAPAERSVRELAAAGTGLSLAELLSLLPDSSVSAMAGEMLIENTRWALAQRDSEREWVPQLFGTQPPILSAARKALVAPEAGWYQDTFGPAYLTWTLDGLTGAGAPKVHLNDAQRAKLKGLLTAGLAKSTAYAKQSHGLTMEAYVTAKPRLALYLEDAASGWPNQLFAAISDPAALQMIANRIESDGNADAASAYATLLYALDRTGALAKRYEQLVLTRMLMVASLSSEVGDRELAMTWMPDVLAALANELEARPDPEGQEIARALREAAEDLGDFTELAKAFADAYIQYRGKGIARQSEEAAEAFARAYPRLAQAGQAMFALAWAGGMLNVIIAFLDWDELDAEDRAKAINVTVGLVADAADRGIGVLQGMKTSQDFVELRQMTSEGKTLDRFAEAPELMDGENWATNGGKATARLFDDEAGTVVVAGTRWESILANAAKVVAWIGVAVAAAVAVFSTIDFIKDIASGAPVSKTVLDGLLAAASIATAVTGALGLFYASTIAMFASSVFAVLGAVITLIEILVPEPPKPTPVDLFMREHGVPFAEALPTTP